jgi:predicted nucleic acid-binding protein
MEIVADTSAFLAVLLNEPERDRILQLTTEASLLAPEFLAYEIGNALSAMVKRRRLTGPEALKAATSARRIAVRLLPVDLHDSLSLALDHGVYAYDASFLHCAQARACPLLTLDTRMKQVAGRIGIEVLEVEP